MKSFSLLCLSLNLYYVGVRVKCYTLRGNFSVFSTYLTCGCQFNYSWRLSLCHSHHVAFQMKLMNHKGYFIVLPCTFYMKSLLKCFKLGSSPLPHTLREKKLTSWIKVRWPAVLVSRLDHVQYDSSKCMI